MEYQECGGCGRINDVSDDVCLCDMERFRKERPDEYVDMRDDLIADLIGDMDIPAMRMDIDNPANVRWLLRNLGIRNANHKNFEEAFRLLKEKAKEEQ